MGLRPFFKRFQNASLPQPRHGALQRYPRPVLLPINCLPGFPVVKHPDPNKTDDFPSRAHQTPRHLRTHGSKRFFLSGSTATPFERLQLLYHPQHFLLLAFTRLHVTFFLLALSTTQLTAPSNIMSSSSATSPLALLFTPVLQLLADLSERLVFRSIAYVLHLPLLAFSTLL
jgi:hypothetical protein